MATTLEPYWYILVISAGILYFIAKNSNIRFYGFRRSISAVVASLLVYGLLLLIGPKFGFSPELTINDITRIVIFIIGTTIVTKALHDKNSKFYIRGLK